MSSIDSVQQIVAAIRAEMAARIRPGESRKQTTSVKQSDKEKAGAKVRTQQLQQRLGGLIGQRVKALDPDDPKRGKKAFRIFLESILLVELGETLINDPGFYQMIDDIQRTMEQDPRITEAIDKAVSILLAAPPSDGQV